PPGGGARGQHQHGRDCRLSHRIGCRLPAHAGPGRAGRDLTGAYVPLFARPGTVAAGLGDRVEPAEKKRRSLAMRGRSEVLSRHRAAAKLGGTEAVLVDKVAEKQCSGYSPDYTRCYL